LTFHDKSELEGSAVVTVNVYQATLTVYADPPKNPSMVYWAFPKKIVGVCYTGNDIGHSFWRVSVEKKQGWGTNKMMQDQYNEFVYIAGNHWGFYPEGWKKMSLALKPYKGVIRNDSKLHHLKNAVFESYPITLDKAKSVIDKTIELKSNHSYHLQNTLGLGRNCTGQTVYISNKIAGLNAPEGKGKVYWRPSEDYPIPIPAKLLRYPNPYHHAEQIKKINQ
jgi:hypothetical protein